MRDASLYALMRMGMGGIPAPIEIPSFSDSLFAGPAENFNLFGAGPAFIGGLNGTVEEDVFGRAFRKSSSTSGVSRLKAAFKTPAPNASSVITMSVDLRRSRGQGATVLARCEPNAGIPAQESDVVWGGYSLSFICAQAGISNLVPRISLFARGLEGAVKDFGDLTLSSSLFVDNRVRRVIRLDVIPEENGDTLIGYISSDPSGETWIEAVSGFVEADSIYHVPFTEGTHCGFSAHNSSHFTNTAVGVSNWLATFE